MAPRVKPYYLTIHEMGRPVYEGIIRDMAGAYIDVASAGADPTGTMDSTAAINAAITEALTHSPPKAILFPPGRIKTQGGHSVTNGTDLSIYGSGIGATTLEITHATNNLFSWTGFNSRFEFGNMTIDSPNVARTGGYVLDGPIGNESYIHDLHILRQANGIWLRGYSYSWLERILIDAFATGGTYGLRIGAPLEDTSPQGVELHINAVTVFGSNVTGSAWVCPIGVQFEDVNAIYADGLSVAACATHCFKIIANTGEETVNLLLTDCLFDATTDNHSTYVTGAGTVKNFYFTNCWFASAGQGLAYSGTGPNANGIRVDAATVGPMSFIGGTAVYSRGTGIYMAQATPGTLPVIIQGMQIRDNGQSDTALNADGMYFHAGAGTVGPTIMGCMEGSSFAGSGLSLRTPAGSSTKLIVMGNRWTRGKSYGAAPETDTGNIG
jgi:hypothetical protein